MGSFLTNHQVRSDSSERVIEVLRGIITEPAYVSDAVGGWVSVYCEETEAQAEEPIQRIGAHLSQELAAPVFAFLVHDSDIFYYWLYEQGTLRDEYNSAPDYFAGMDDDLEDASPQDHERTQGRAEVVLPHCTPGTTQADVEAVIHPPEPTEADPARVSIPTDLSATPGIAALVQMLGVTPEQFQQQMDLHTRRKYQSAEDQAEAFSELLGLDPERTRVGYKYITQEEAEFPLTQIGPGTLSQDYLNRKLWSNECIHQPDVLRGWINKGADPNARNAAGETILFHKAAFCLSGEVRVLLEAGAAVDGGTVQSQEYGWERGVTPLMAAAGALHMDAARQTETMQRLIDAGADVNAQSESGRTALKAASGFMNPAQAQWKRPPAKPVPPQQVEQVIEMLRAAGAVPSAGSPHGLRLLVACTSRGCCAFSWPAPSRGCCVF